jgi:hypothetical protein
MPDAPPTPNSATDIRISLIMPSWLGANLEENLNPRVDISKP